MVQIRVRVGILGPPVGFDPYRPSKWGYLGSKARVPTMPPFFPTREVDLPRLEIYRVFDLFFVGNGGPLMLAYSNMHVSEESSIFGNQFSMTFSVSHGFVTPIKSHRVTDFYLTCWFWVFGGCGWLDTGGCC